MPSCHARHHNAPLPPLSPAQTFNKLQTHTGNGLLMLAVMCLLLPAVLDATNTEAIDTKSALLLSRVVSIMMLVAHVAGWASPPHPHYHPIPS